MMTLFSNPGILLGGAAFALVAIPIIIHLINLLRHRRVQWAAMEFLRVSQRKNRAWILLKQLLLLLVRMAAVAAVLLMLAQPVLRGGLGRMFGSRTTHHIVLLDDSFSQADRWGNTSALEEAKQAVRRIGQRAVDAPSKQSFTLLRYSRAGRNDGAARPDLLKEPVEADFAVRLASLLETFQPSELDTAPAAPLEAVRQLPEQTGDEDRRLYLVSDFRRRQWDEPQDVARLLSDLNAQGVRVHLVNCVDAARPNLAVTDLKPLAGTRAAGVPLLMEVSVKNFGENDVKNVSVLLQENGAARPALVIDAIDAGDTETRQFPVLFPIAGEHVVSAHLEGDSVSTDNVRWAVVDFPQSVPALVIDGDPLAADARFLRTAFEPGGSVRTGVEPRIEPPSFLTRNDLNQFHAIYLVNVARLGQPAVDALEDYVRRGGGLGIFLGPRSAEDTSFYNEQLYREGAGLMPAPIDRAADLRASPLESTVDLEVTEHPIFKVFAGQRNTFLSAVKVARYVATADDWQPPARSTTRVIARLRGGAPLVIEQQFGAGRVIAVMTTAAPSWNNWGRNPSFVVAMLEMQSHLAAGRLKDRARLAGQPLELQFDAEKYQERVQVRIPGDGLPLVRTAAAGTNGKQVSLTMSETDRSGVYEIQLATTGDEVETRRFAYNVTAEEGDLATVDGAQLADRLQNVEYQYSGAAEFEAAEPTLAGFNLSEGLLYALIFVLLAEQLLAYLISYHPARQEAPA